MPAGFEKCVREKGKIRTVQLGKNKYRYVCTIKGKSYYGEVHTKKSNNK